MTDAACKYPGFISYSHRDRAVAEWLHRAIERYRVPRRLIGSPGAHGPVPARLYPIFRDRDELAAGPLAGPLMEAIGQSRCFVLICSPESAASRWVNDEVAEFLKHSPPSRLLCLIADGEPHAADPARECLPPVLRERGIEALAAELHDDADGRDHARLKIIAGLLGVGFDELRRRDLVARNRRLIAIAGLSLVVATLTVVLALVALRARDEAERSRQQGEELIGFMLGELREQLEPLGKLGLLDAVGDRAMAYFAGLDGGRAPGPRALAARARALRQIGEVRLAQGRPEEALQTLVAALALQRERVAATPDDDEQRFELGQTEYWVGYAAWRAGDFDRAEARFRAYQQIAETLAARAPARIAWQAEVAYAWNNLGVLAFERRRYADAHALFGRALAAGQALQARGPVPPDLEMLLIGTLPWEGQALMKLGDSAAAMAIYARHADRLRRLLADRPDDRRAQNLLTSSLSTYGFSALEIDQPLLALDIAREGAAVATALVQADPANLDNLASLAYHQQIEGTARFQLRQWPAATEALDAAIGSLDRLLALDPSQQLPRLSLLSARELAFALHWRAGQPNALRTLAHDALAGLDTLAGDAAEAPTIRAAAHLLALEVALYVDRDPAAAARHRQAASAALDAADERAPELGRRVSRLQTLLGLMSGLGHVPDAAWPENHAAWTYSVVGFIERHCPQTGASEPTLDCRQLRPVAAAARAAPSRPSAPESRHDP